MAIKAGQLIHVGNGRFLLERIQTGGPGQLNIPIEHIYELGNYQGVGLVLGTPDLSFALDSYDMSDEIERFMTNTPDVPAQGNATTATTGGTVAAGVYTYAFSYVNGSNVETSMGPVNTITTTGSTSTITFDSPVADPDATGYYVYCSQVGGSTLTLQQTLGSPITLATNYTITAPPSSGGQAPLNLGLDLANCVSVDIATQFKGGITSGTPYAVIASAAMPLLYLESASYKFAAGDTDSSQSFTLRGDSLFYNPGPTYVQTAVASGSPGQTVITTYPAYAVAEADNRRILSVEVGGVRLTFGPDYSESYGSISGGAATTTVTITAAQTAGQQIRIMYSSPQALSFNQGVHTVATVKPAAIRGRDVDVYVGGYDYTNPAGSVANLLTSVQSVDINWKVTLDKDQELGNPYIVSQDFFVPDVNGSITVKPRTPAELAALIRKVQGVSDATKSLGALTAVPLAMDIVVYYPGTKTTLKRIHIPDARYTLPGFSGRVQTKTTWQLSWASDTGSLQVFSDNANSL